MKYDEQLHQVAIQSFDLFIRTIQLYSKAQKNEFVKLNIIKQSTTNSFAHELDGTNIDTQIRNMWQEMHTTLASHEQLYARDHDHQSVTLKVDDSRTTDTANGCVTDEYIRIHNKDRLTMLEELTSMIFNEFNHPFSIIANYANGCIRRLEATNCENGELLQALKKIVHTTTYYSENIYKRLKYFKCKSAISYQWVKIDDLVNESVIIIKKEHPEYIMSLYYRPFLHLPEVFLDKIHIVQVIITLARNAIEAMQAGNTREPHLVIESELVGNNMIAINMIDNGPGFSTDIGKKLFDINFSTKFYGTCHGLAMCRTIVEAHGGTLQANALLSGGCFKMLLPIIAI